MKNKKVIFIVVLILAIAGIYYFVILPKTKQKLATQIMEKYPEDNFNYELLKTYSTKCLNGILNDKTYTC